MKKPKKKKKSNLQYFCCKSRLFLDVNQKYILDFLCRQSRAIYNSTLYYAKKILDDDDFKNQYNDFISEYKKIPKNIVSENGLKMYIAHHCINYKNVTSHIGQQTSKRVYKAIKSFFELKKAGFQKAKFPHFLKRNRKYNIYFTSNIFKKEKINNNHYIRLTVGQYVKENFIKITQNKDLIHLNNGNYIDKKCLIDAKKSTFKKIKINDHVKYYDSADIINGSYLYVPISSKIYEKNISEIEIKPLYNGQKYEIIYKFTTKKKTLQINEKNKVVSVDIGLNNLMTVFSPTNSQTIYDGKKLKSINEFYNIKIGHQQGVLAKTTDKFQKLKERCKLNNLFDKRGRLINDYLHKISKTFINNCKQDRITKVIIGYNQGWKTNINIGTSNNRKFYQIPFNRLLEMIEYKAKNNNISVIRQEESYTSKCDALAGEPVKKQVFKFPEFNCILGKYKGRRITRGCFQSSIGQKINADINGAINIYRKGLNLMNNKKGYEFTFKLRQHVNMLKLFKKVKVNVK